MKKKNKKNQLFGGQKKPKEKSEKSSIFSLPDQTKRWILGIITFILAIIVALSFFDLAGVAGKAIMTGLTFLIGKAIFATPLILILGSLVFFVTRYEKFVTPSILAIFILILGITGILESFSPAQRSGGLIGYALGWPFLKFFSPLVAKIVFGAVIFIGGVIFWHLTRMPQEKENGKDKKSLLEQGPEKEPSFIQKIFIPKFRSKEVEPRIKESTAKIEEPILELKSKDIPRFSKKSGTEYKMPPLDLLEADKGKPLAGDTVTNSAIIKKTLENFGLGVEMSEINIGPTVTQYTLKPAEGIMLSKITALNNNLSLALASHPIRIEAPIPGKSLVGIEVPNKERCKVRLRGLIADPNFQNSFSRLTLTLGRDVSGNSIYADLARMPHLLVAGATGTGKTIFLNNLILTLLYQNSPETLRLILIDPKRVEFNSYKELPHLLAPVIFDAQRSVNALKWLVHEMERRFEVLSDKGSRDILSYNSKVLKDGEEPLPYIILIIDELADLMAAKGREIEAGIVRLAQMARAVGIHLIVATQRPSVEIITGLIKANITSRVTFQVASQVDSRTVIDTGGAEKLIGSGDLLFISADVAKPKRVQGSYVSEKEVKRVVDFIKDQNFPTEHGFDSSLDNFQEGASQNHLSQDLVRSLNGEAEYQGSSGEKDPLYEEAKKTVIEFKKASASFLQRRLKLGYARAARILDELESEGVVGPGEGSKAREVFSKSEIPQPEMADEKEEFSEDEEWKKV
ncbi:MAG: DNA translocase FtsK [Candidatus Nealsonbacteria bacterium]|nr:DNA translocase FtsK [Candidatus Nealsonbacteria bacterium]